MSDVENRKRPPLSLMRGLTLDERARVYREYIKLIDAAETDPAMRALIIMAARGLANRHGLPNVAAKYVRAMQRTRRGREQTQADRQRVAEDLARIDRERGEVAVPLNPPRKRAGGIVTWERKQA